ncbi:MAG: DNA polymerase I, partial [Lachnospiraceae bacterium]|nr:DNA polymerase I [Lachnospiraceae bacterium]
MMGKLLLMDGHSILSRAFYGVPELTNSKGLHTNAVYGFLNILFKVIEEEQPEYITVAFDVKHPTFRHEMYSEYKGTRKPMPAELHEQVPVLKELLRAMNVTVVEKPGFEADDLLGTMARIAEGSGCNVTIVSGDRDLLQLVTEKVTLRIPKTKAGKTVVEDYTPDKVREVYQLEPGQIIDLKGLMG